MDFAEFQSRMVPVKPDPPLEGLALDLYQSNATGTRWVEGLSA